MYAFTVFITFSFFLRPAKPSPFCIQRKRFWSLGRSVNIAHISSSLHHGSFLLEQIKIKMLVFDWIVLIICGGKVEHK